MYFYKKINSITLENDHEREFCDVGTDVYNFQENCVNTCVFGKNCILLGESRVCDSPTADKMIGADDFKKNNRIESKNFRDKFIYCSIIPCRYHLIAPNQPLGYF